jgi:hypothetical protein
MVACCFSTNLLYPSAHCEVGFPLIAPDNLTVVSYYIHTLDNMNEAETHKYILKYNYEYYKIDCCQHAFLFSYKCLHYSNNSRKFLRVGTHVIKFQTVARVYKMAD